MKALSYSQMELVCGGAEEGFWHTVRVGADLVCGMWAANLLLSRFAYTNPVTGTVATVLDVGCTLVGLGELGNAIWNNTL